MGKSEEVVSEEIENIEEVAMAKSEGDLQSEIEELKKSLSNYEELVGQLFNKKAPEGKAVTGLNVIEKSEGTVEEVKEDKVSEMKKSEITSKLKTLDYGELTKSDRNAINEYCLNNTSVESIKHLITE